MLLLDRLLEGDSTRAAAEFTVRDDSPLLEPGKGLPAWALLEHFAQTAALIGGLKAREDQVPVAQGFLLGTRKLTCTVSHIPVGTTLVLEAETGFVDGNGMGAYHCRVRDPAWPVSCTLTVYTPPKETSTDD
jgi:predicted hotdog family 3-hydroxylacyl-ACP dehydratase